MPNIAESLEAAANALQSAEIAEARREASSLLCFALQKNRAFLIAHPEYELQSREMGYFQSIVNRRANREPFHHITGVKEFYGLEFQVSPDVLIPRPETEMLVARGIEILREINKPTFCEVGIGSGCIAVSLLHHVEKATAVGLEISEAAIVIAHRNAKFNGVSGRLKVLRSDVFSGLGEERFDLIVSNPPYIPIEDIGRLQPEVKDFEPLIALSDGAEGLSIIEKIIRQSPVFLKSGGSLVLEIGVNQAESIVAMFDLKLWENIYIVPDFHKIPRMVCATLILR